MRRILLLFAFLLAAGGAQADGPWSGRWRTTWRDGGAQVRLDQQGDRVTGVYPLYGGRIEGVARGRTLEGRWIEDDDSGTFAIVLSRDGGSFSGHYGSGEWWTGERNDAPEAALDFNLRTPRSAFRHFIAAANLARNGQPEAWALAAQAVDFGRGAPLLTRGRELHWVQLLFTVIDLTTFRMSSIPGDAVGNTASVRLVQVNSDATFTLTLARDGNGDWRIRISSEDDLLAARKALLASRGGQLPTPDAYRKLQNPRDTMHAFLVGMADWDGPGRKLALSTLDLSHIPEALRQAQGELAAHFLRRALAHVGIVALQSIPDDGNGHVPYEHFSHPAGRIVIAPTGPEADAPWKFTAQTVEDADDVYIANHGLVPPEAIPPGRIPDAPYFTLRNFIAGHAPFLLNRAGRAEYWQLIGAITLLVVSGLLGVLATRLIRAGLRRQLGDLFDGSRQFAWALGITVTLLLAGPFISALGIPEAIQQYSYPVFGLVLVLSGAVVAWHLLGVAGLMLSRLADRTSTSTDDILFTLLLAAARLGVVVAASLAAADFLSIPTSNILAGLGIGGLAFAFASRETLSNVFGAGILVTDRPFRRGDWITAENVEGAVEHLGIRSTRVRTAQDSVMVVPNGKLADSVINNLGTRRHRLIEVQLKVTAGGTPERLAAFVAAVRGRIDGDSAFVASRTDVGVSEVAEGCIAVAVTTYADVGTDRAERAARHALLLDILRLATEARLTLGGGSESPAIAVS